jgi:hypothetical protein
VREFTLSLRTVLTRLDAQRAFNDPTGSSPTGGLLFANPIPEEFSIPKAEIDLAINQAVQEAADQGFHGHLNTPFILSRIKDLTKGNSIPANRALIESNVRMATQVAVELSKMRRDGRILKFGAPRQPRIQENNEPSPAVLTSPLTKTRSGREVTNNNNNHVILPDTLLTPFAEV